MIIFRDGNLWHSFRHHSRFSHTDPELCIDGINRELKAGAEQLLPGVLVVGDFRYGICVFFTGDRKGGC